VKSLVNFPQVLTMMSEKLDWTQKLGNAFLAHQKPVMDTIQSLRAKAQAAGNLKTTTEQTVIVEQKIIKIESASPQVIYVPTYNPTVVYGAWPYPAYPPYYYYPPGYVATTAAVSFAAGVAMGAAWGYAWGNTNYHGGNVDINNSQNININNNINRQNYSSQTVQQRYNQATPSQQVQARQAYRGHTGSALTPQEQQQAQQRAQQAQQQQTGQQAQQARQQQTTQQGQPQQRAQQAQQTQQARGGAFEGIDRGGSSARSASQRGSVSRSSFGAAGGRSGGGRSGGGRR
jgi:Spy/CpxP family protein refolding chaperone